MTTASAPPSPVSRSVSSSVRRCEPAALELGPSVGRGEQEDAAARMMDGDVVGRGRGGADDPLWLDGHADRGQVRGDRTAAHGRGVGRQAERDLGCLEGCQGGVGARDRVPTKDEHAVDVDEQGADAAQGIRRGGVGHGGSMVCRVRPAGRAGIEAPP